MGRTTLYYFKPAGLTGDLSCSESILLIKCNIFIIGYTLIQTNKYSTFAARRLYKRPVACEVEARRKILRFEERITPE